MDIIVEPKPHGLILEKPKPEDYVFGSGKIAGDMLQPSGDWSDYLPIFELQHNGSFETFNCTNYGTHNALEILLQRKYGIKANFSERYSGIMTGTTQSGNSPHKVIETIRNYAGAVPEERLPFSRGIDTWDEYYSGVSWSLKMEGLSWLRQWEVKHEWVFEPESAVDNKHERILDALKFSPLGVSVQAWSKKGNLYVKTGMDNHWVTLIKATRHYYLVFDHYSQEVKRLDPAYDFYMAKKYHIEPRKSLDTQFLIRATRGLLGIY